MSKQLLHDLEVKSFLTSLDLGHELKAKGGTGGDLCSLAGTCANGCIDPPDPPPTAMDIWEP